MQNQNQYPITLSGFNLQQKELGEEIKERSHTDFNLCYQCQACFSGCPFSGPMDYSPNQIIRLLQLVFFEESLITVFLVIYFACFLQKM